MSKGKTVKVALFTLMLLCITVVAFAKVYYLNMGSTSSASPIYAWCVATANAINKEYDDIRVTVVESGAALDNLRRLRDGEFDFALAVDLPSAMQMYKGIDAFKGTPWKEVRWLLVRNVIADRVYVLKELNIKNFAELEGKPFCPGLPGSSSANYMMRMAEALGLKMNFRPASLADAIELLKQKKIVALQQSSPIDSMSAALLEVHIHTPLTVVGFTKEQVERIRQVYPYLSFIETPKGGIKQLPDAGPFYEEAPIVGAVASSKLPQEVGYKIIKAYVKRFNEIAEAWPAIKGWDPVRDFFKYAQPGGDIPAHAGLVQYAKEIGIEVPERLIPPEYKP